MIKRMSMLGLNMHNILTKTVNSIIIIKKNMNIKIERNQRKESPTKRRQYA